MNRYSIPVVCFLLLAAAGATAQIPAVGDNAPLRAPRTVTLQEQWRVGGEDSEHVFGLVIDAVADGDGNVYLLDNQLCQVTAFDESGEYVRTLSRQGEGPGEVRTPMAVEWMPDGTLGMLELFPSKLVKVGRDGTPAGNCTLLLGEENQTGFTASISVACLGDVLLSAGHRALPTDGGQNRLIYLSSFDREGHELVRFCEHHAFLQFTPPLFIEREHLPAFYFASAVGPDGRVYASTDRDSYRIEVYRPDGTPDRVISRTFEPWTRDGRDRARMNAIIDAWFQRVPGGVQRELSEYEQTINELFVDSEGVLWVQHSRSGRERPAGVLLSYDTYDADGNYLQEVSFACPGDAAYDGLRFLGDGRVLLIKGWVLARWAATGAQNVDFGEDASDEAPEIVCYRMDG